MKAHFGCPVQATSNVFSGKWKVLIVWHLAFGSLRHAELQRRLPGVSQKVLTAQLRELERDGIVARKVFHEVPPKVEYSLTKYGQTLRPVMTELCHWGKKHKARMAAD